MEREKLAKVATAIVLSYLSTRKVPAADMARLVGGVCKALNATAASAPEPPPAPAPRSVPERWKPAVPVRRSVRPDAIVCLICGKSLVTLRRHLGSAHGLSREQYCERFDLSGDYPMDAPAYTQVRSALAKARGLGNRIAWKERPSADPDRRRRRRREAVSRPQAEP